MSKKRAQMKLPNTLPTQRAARAAVWEALAFEEELALDVENRTEELKGVREALGRAAQELRLRLAVLKEVEDAHKQEDLAP